MWRAALTAGAALLTEEYTAWDAQTGSQLPACPRCGMVMAHLRRAARYIVTRTGTLRVRRHVYYCRRCRVTHAPLDAALELDDTQYSKPARQWCVCMGAALPFGEAQTLLRMMTAVAADASVIEDFCQRAGQRLEQPDATTSSLPARPIPPPEHLYVSVDGAHAPIRDPERPWQEVRVGALFTTAPGREGPRLTRREYLAFLGPMRDFVPRLWHCAARWGAAGTHHITFLSDGAPANWGVADMLFPGACQILDFYHACAHLRVIRDLIFTADDPAGTVWWKRQCRRLKHGRWKAVMAAITARTARKGTAQLRRTEIAYFHKNRHRMHYLQYRRRGLYIGSGVVESACKQVVSRRIKVSGARWKPKSCQHMLNLRCAYLSNRIALEHAA